MKIFSSIILFVGLVIFGSFFISSESAKAAIIPAPTVTFTGGDDVNQNGNFDDAYDSLIIFEIYAPQPAGFTGYILQYSVNQGQSWNNITTADYTVIEPPVTNRRYYWSTSGIYAPQLWFRAYSNHSPGGQSESYQTPDLSLSHRLTDYNLDFFSENFTDTLYKDPSTDANWDTARFLVELPWNGSRYLSPRYAYSKDLMPPGNTATITGITLQPVHIDTGQPQYIGYKVSNDGLTWYPSGNNWYNGFPIGQTVPTPWEYNFSVFNTKLYWRAKLFTNNNQITPRIYQVRINWTENHLPQACFVATPINNYLATTTPILFNADCSGDVENSLGQMSFRWNWGDGSPTTTWLTGGYSRAHIFSSTSTYTINLEVKDTLGGIDGYQSNINYETLTGDIYGWMWSTGYGWTSLNCDNIYYPISYPSSINLCLAGNYGLSINDQNQEISGWAWNSFLGWLCFGSSCDVTLYGNPPGTLPGTQAEASYSSATGEVNGWGKFILEPVFGWLALNNNGLGNWCDYSLPDPPVCTNINFSDRTITGFAWAGGQEASSLDKVGPGWQQFAGNLNLPWLETLYGTMYSKGGVRDSDEGMPPPPNRYTASYCILSSGTIVGFTSGIGCTENVYRQIEYPEIANSYRNILGVIDFNRILDGNQTRIHSRYIDPGLSNNLPNILGGQVYEFYGNYDSFSIDNPFIIFNAVGSNSSGAGTVVINGDLLINDNFYYEETAVGNQIENLASVVWIVKGDLIIDPSVSHIVGTFIVLGDGVTVCPGDNCGQLQTGDDSADPKQLVVSGMVMARQINFQRHYKSGGEPAEQIIYDGRVLVNVPPGLDDLAKALPIWQETTATNQVE